MKKLIPFLFSIMLVFGISLINPKQAQAQYSEDCWNNWLYDPCASLDSDVAIDIDDAVLAANLDVGILQYGTNQWCEAYVNRLMFVGSVYEVAKILFTYPLPEQYYAYYYYEQMVRLIIQNVDCNSTWGDYYITHIDSWGVAKAKPRVGQKNWLQLEEAENNRQHVFESLH